VAKYMGGAPARAFDLSSAHRLFDDHGDGTMIREASKRRTSTKKNGVDIASWSSLQQVIRNGLADLLGKRKACGVSALPADRNPGALPVDISQL